MMARERFGADIGLGTTGIVGLDCSDGRAAGLAYIGLASGRSVKSWQHGYPAHPDVARHRLAMAALFRLRRCLLDDWS
jgi:nicotinamide mononucleotide (NMN) deamidase PncC